MRITQIVIFVLLLAGGTFAVPGSATFSYTNDDGSWTETEYSDVPAEAIRAGDPVPPDSEILWDHEVVGGQIPRFAVIDYNDDYVWQGGLYGSLRLYEMTGNGTPLWEFYGDAYNSVAAAQTEDIFYGASNNSTNTVFKVYKFNHNSSTPDWVWDGAAAGYHAAYLDKPGFVACSNDGSVFAVGGYDGDSLAVFLFHDDSPTPFLIYEDETIAEIPLHVRLTADGSKCLFTSGHYVYRLDVVTGTMECVCDAGYRTECFEISPDASVIAAGSGFPGIFQWDGSQYVHQFYAVEAGYKSSRGAIAADNDTIFLSWQAQDWSDVAVSLFSLANGETPLWTWKSAPGSGSHQDVCVWADISDDGEWMASCSWGNQNNSHPEVLVFKSDSPTPWFSIDTPALPSLWISAAMDNTFVAAARAFTPTPLVLVAMLLPPTLTMTTLRLTPLTSPRIVRTKAFC